MCRDRTLPAKGLCDPGPTLMSSAKTVPELCGLKSILKSRAEALMGKDHAQPLQSGVLGLAGENKEKTAVLSCAEVAEHCSRITTFPVHSAIRVPRRLHAGQGYREQLYGDSLCMNAHPSRYR